MSLDEDYMAETCAKRYKKGVEVEGWDMYLVRADSERHTIVA